MGLVLERVDELLEPRRRSNPATAPRKSDRQRAGGEPNAMLLPTARHGLEAPEQGGGSVTPPPCGSMTRRSLLSRAPDQR
jgi:hypothetical protein